MKREQESYQSQLTEVVQGLHEKIKLMEKSSKEGVDPHHKCSIGDGPQVR